MRRFYFQNSEQIIRSFIAVIYMTLRGHKQKQSPNSDKRIAVLQIPLCNKLPSFGLEPIPSLKNKPQTIQNVHTFIPFNCFKNVKAIPPPMIISLTLSNKFSIKSILSATLAPPKMAKNGL